MSCQLGVGGVDALTPPNIVESRCCVSMRADLNCWFPFGVEQDGEEAAAPGGLLQVPAPYKLYAKIPM